MSDKAKDDRRRVAFRNMNEVGTEALARLMAQFVASPHGGFHTDKGLEITFVGDALDFFLEQVRAAGYDFEVLSEEEGTASRRGGEKRPATGYGTPGDRHVVFSNLEGRDGELRALMGRFDVSAYQLFHGERAMPSFVFLGDRIDFFLAQLRQAGFEFEEREGWA